jgi:hypothetical protein
MELLDIDLLLFKKDLIIKSEGDQLYIWDLIRKKNILVQPEEMVRQMLIRWLIFDIKIGSALIAV